MSSISISKTHLLNTKREQIYNKEFKTPTKKIEGKKLALVLNLRKFDWIQQGPDQIRLVFPVRDSVVQL